MSLDGTPPPTSEDRPGAGFWELINRDRTISASSARVLWTLFLVVYLIVVASRVIRGHYAEAIARLPVVLLATFGIARSRGGHEGDHRYLTFAFAFVLPWATYVAVGLAEERGLTEIVMTGVGIVTAFAFVSKGRDLMIALALVPPGLWVLRQLLPPHPMGVMEQARLLLPAFAIGTGLALLAQYYRGLLADTEDDLRHSLKKLQQANAAKSTFLATMSHELRTPMMGVLGSADLLTQFSLDAEARKHVEQIRQSGEDQLRVINEILDFSKVEAGAIELDVRANDLEATVSAALEPLRVAAEARGLELRTSVSRRPPILTFDSFRFRQVLRNLVSNAIKFTTEGFVEVRVRTVIPEDDAAPRLIAEVEDSGPGIPKERREAIFQPFVQATAGTTREYGGTGLGLPISERLARLMGGGLELHEAPGGGCLFRLEIEVAVSDEKSVNESTGGFDLPLTGEASVLVVDDQPVNRKVAEAMLASLGYRSVSVVSSGEEAIHRTLTAQPDVVLMDMHMPDVDGLVATQRIREALARKDRPYIAAFTANALETDRRRCEEAGMNGFVMKPVTLAGLRKAMYRAERALRASAND